MYLEIVRFHIFILNAAFYNKEVTKNIEKTKNYVVIDSLRDNNKPFVLFVVIGAIEDVFTK